MADVVQPAGDHDGWNSVPVTASAPYDRALALASLIRTMRDHYLAVQCTCGAARVIAIARMARDRRLADRTLAHVALRLSCEGCRTGPDVQGGDKPGQWSGGMVLTRAE